MATNSYIADRGEAVNLARTVLEQPGDPEITTKGIVKLARAVLDMDEWISLHNGPQYEPLGFVWEDPAGKTFHEVAPKTSLFSFTEVFKRTDAAQENK